MSNKLIYTLCILAMVYLGLHMLEFGLNTSYRNRFNNEAYMSGQESVKIYQVFPRGGV